MLQLTLQIKIKMLIFLERFRHVVAFLKTKIGQERWTFGGVHAKIERFKSWKIRIRNAPHKQLLKMIKNLFQIYLKNTTIFIKHL